MRIRKILPLALLAVGMLFMLTSCDKMLDAIFSSNTINVNVQAYDLRYFGYTTGGTITVYLYGSSGSTYQAGPATYQYLDGNYFANYNFSFSKLPNDTYTVGAAYTGSFNGGVSTPGGPYYAGYFFDPSSVYTNVITMPYSGGGSPATANIIVVMP